MLAYKNKALVILFLLSQMVTTAQTVLTIQGQTFTNSSDTWLGVNPARSVPTIFTFKNNLITSINTVGYQLQAGDETSGPNNNHLAGAVITGNKLSWSGTNMTSITHGIFTGHNQDVIIKYNYLNHVPMAIIRKSTNNMTNTSGGVAYNIVKGGAVAIVVKGMSNVNIYNNTLYTDRTTSQTFRPLVDVYTNIDITPHSVSHGTKIYNNIFYTKNQTLDISIEDNESLTGLECDYNVYWCENGKPSFNVSGVVKSFAEWQALGYDQHSVVINPDFIDLTNFVPKNRLDYGTSLDSAWIKGLSPNAIWGTTDPRTRSQNGKWQVGAVVYGATAEGTDSVPEYVDSQVENATPNRLDIYYSIAINPSIVPDTSAFKVNVNSKSMKILKIDISGSIVSLTLASKIVYSDVITIAYTIPSVNQLQSTLGKPADPFPPRPVINDCLPGGGNAELVIYPNPAQTYINVTNLESSPQAYKIKIFDSTGKLRSETMLDPDSNTTIPLNLSSGMYIVEALSGSKVKFHENLIVIK
jgi:hypothetical protein